MNKKQIVTSTEEFVKEKLLGEGSGHDWWHIKRVWDLARNIAKDESVDLFIVELGALLHDIADWKFTDGDESVGPRIAGEWLISQGVDDDIVKIVKEAIEDVSFKGAGVTKKNRSKEGEVIQDADRLDAIGAMGIARCIAYGGHKGREIYNPEIKPVMHQTSEEYKKNSGPSMNHFYEKLLLLKNLMNTKTAKKIAENRHEFMEKYLEEFFAEWEGKK